MLTEPVKAAVYLAWRAALAGWAVRAAAAAATRARRGRRERMGATVPSGRRRSIGRPPKRVPGAVARTARDQATAASAPRSPGARSPAPATTAPPRPSQDAIRA